MKPPRLGHVLALVVLTTALGTTVRAQAPRFYPDDPLAREPVPLPVAGIEPRALSAMLEAINNSVKTRGQPHPGTGVIPAQGVNTLGDVMDGEWYVNRQTPRRMAIAELKRGPRDDLPPAAEGSWQVLVVKPFGTNPGLLVADGKRDLYLLRFDPIGFSGMATGANMVTARFLYALGYHVPENYLVRFERSRLVANAEGQTVSSAGRPRRLYGDDIDAFLRTVATADDRTYRAVATRLPESREALLGPYQYWGTRSDDPNDTVPHEHRRDLRGLYVFSAWLNNSGARAVDTHDIMTPIDGVARIRHYIVDFTRSLGSGSVKGPKLVWEGHEPFLAGRDKTRRNILGFGVVTPAWMREEYPDLPEVGTFGSQTFDPDAWTSNDPIMAFENRLPDDTFWAAKQVMAFTDAEIRAVVQTGEYSQAAEDWMTATLIERRNRIGRTYFSRVLPIDRFRVSGATLQFDDLAMLYRLSPARTFTVEWYGFDNATNTLLAPIGTGANLPAAAQSAPEGSYVAARVHAGDPAMSVTIYLRHGATGFDVVGVDRSWPGKVIAPPMVRPRIDRRLYDDLSPGQQALFQTYIDSYNAARGSRYTPEEGFNRLSVSEQTTYYSVTHALLRSQLTDKQRGDMGTAIDRIVSVDRISGQNPGLGGDQEFRVYVTLKPDTREVLENSREFFRAHDNTVYHAGYPYSYRQAGKEPSIQISMSDDGLRGDIDVDYRSRKAPQGLFNGHLTSANSDVRMGDNAKRHNNRWQGLIPWWQQVFGRVDESAGESGDVINSERPDAAPTPLPPDRPLGAAPERLEDAAQEFLTDWLVRHEYEQALAFLSPRAYACLNLEDTGSNKPLDAAAARRELRKLMEYSAGKVGPVPNLTSAIVAFTPRDPQRVVVDQPFQREFLVTPLPETLARTYLCGPATASPAGTEYFGVVLQFRRPGGGTLGLLWTRDAGQWKLVSYQPLDQ